MISMVGLQIICFYSMFVVHTGFTISFKVQYLAECKSWINRLRRNIGEDLHHCVNECQIRPHCKGAVYRRRLRVCDLLTSFDDEDLANTGDCIFINNSDITELQLPCGACGDGKVCSLLTQNCIYRECAKIPLVNGVVLGNTFSIGETVGIVCNRQFSNSLAIRSAMCQENGSWTQYSNCTLDARTCYDVKRCSSSYNDGEYWLYSDVLGGHMVKIYCFEMSTENPQEYITVNEEHNYGFDAGGESREANLAKFKKIRVDMMTGRIIRSDNTFRSPENFGLAYGTARSCDCTNGCRPWKGYFNISLVGTGLKFSDQVEWTAAGWSAGMTHFQRNADNNVISARCGGHCGYCMPNGNMYIAYNVNEVVADDSATHPMCD